MMLVECGRRLSMTWWVFIPSVLVAEWVFYDKIPRIGTIEWFAVRIVDPTGNNSRFMNQLEGYCHELPIRTGDVNGMIELKEGGT